MTWLVIGLFGAALVVFVAAEWPRLFERLSGVPLVARYSARKRRRRRERAHLVLVEDDESDELDGEREAFAESVARDLERLPTIDDRD
ncbi:MAG TPA: hypothetical protein VII83_05880 [Gaiellaceae bacterium]